MLPYSPVYNLKTLHTGTGSAKLNLYKVNLSLLPHYSMTLQIFEDNM